MLGHPASWHTVCRPSRLTRACSSVYSEPIFALILIHGGFFSIGVVLLRASIRNRRRPSGAMLTAGLPFVSLVARARRRGSCVDELGENGPSRDPAVAGCAENSGQVVFGGLQDVAHPHRAVPFRSEERRVGTEDGTSG